jgi:hypothetical protein
VPLKYTRADLAALLESAEAGRYARMSIADYPDGGDTCVIVQGRGKSIRFNRLRVVNDPQYARDLASVLLAWADRETEFPDHGQTSPEDARSASET